MATLLILAAGMGSRYGGLKQLDKMGPNGETIMDYSVKYALESGFNKIVFVIRKVMEQDFKTYILPRYADRVEVQYVFQELDMLPAGFTVNPKRVKPYGTAHAIQVAGSAIHEPFAVINADDFYGREAFQVMANFLCNTPKENHPAEYAMVGYRLDKTLSVNGTVSRGICTTNHQDYLTTIVENHKVGYTDKGIENIEDGLCAEYDGSEPVSMNFWGFTTDFFNCLDELFVDFLKRNQENIKSEFPIPDVISYLMKNKLARVKVLRCNAQWFGVTYQEDRPEVVKKLKELQD